MRRKIPEFHQAIRNEIWFHHRVNIEAEEERIMMMKNEKQQKKAQNQRNENQRKQRAQNKQEKILWVNLPMFYAKMRELDIDVVSLSEAIGMSKSSMYRKLKGESQFTLQEVSRLKAVMQLTTEEMYQIFIAGYLTEAA